MTKYLQKSPFSVMAGGTQQYRDNWDAIFGKKEESEVAPLYHSVTTPFTVREQVKEFHQTFGAPIGLYPNVIARERLALRLKLIAEEFVELLEACGVGSMAYAEDDEYVGDFLDRIISMVSVKHRGWWQEMNLVATADALADLAYVVEGMNLELGINSVPVLKEVHASNMSKLDKDGNVVRREDGKIMKSDQYQPPRIDLVLKEQGWPGPV